MLPPAVAGIALLAALGPSGILGGALEDAGIQLTFETAGVVVALTFVASPFYLRQAQASFAALDRSWLDASRTLGASPRRGRSRGSRSRPRAPGLVAGGALACGRALGEFGATLMFAGSLAGVTQTAPLAIYERFATDFDGRARAVGGARRRLGRASCSRSSSFEGECSLGTLRDAVEAAHARPAGRPRARRRARGRGRRVPRARRPVGRRQDAACCASSPGCVAPARRPRARAASDVWLDTERGVDLPPEARRCGYVFQDYALFPHLSAWQNVAYGLREPPARSGARGRRSCSSASASSARADARPRTLVGRRAPARRARARARAAAARAAARRAALRARRPHPSGARRASWPQCCARPACRPCSSRTTSPRRPCSATGSGSSTRARSCRRAPRASWPPPPQRRSSPTSPARSC